MRRPVESNSEVCTYRIQDFAVGPQLRRTLARQGLEIMDHVGLIAISKFVRDTRPIQRGNRLLVDRSLEPEDACVDLWPDTYVICESPFELPQAESHNVSERLNSKATLPRNHGSDRRLKAMSRIRPGNELAEKPIRNLNAPAERFGFRQF